MMNDALADRYRMMIAEMLGVSNEEILNIMIDAGKDYLVDFLGEGNADEVQRFAAIPDYWAWFRQLWANADVQFMSGMNEFPHLINEVKKYKVELQTYAKHHWYEMNGKRPASYVMSTFAKVSIGKSEVKVKHPSA